MGFMRLCQFTAFGFTTNKGDKGTSFLYTQPSVPFLDRPVVKFNNLNLGKYITVLRLARRLKSALSNCPNYFHKFPILVSANPVSCEELFILELDAIAI
jgi:hypothetical protein